MIMQEQELTLFGGWAKALTPQPIEIGVVKPLDKPSASIYIRYAEEPLTLEYMGSQVLAPHITAEPSKITEYMKPLIEIEVRVPSHFSGREVVLKNWQQLFMDRWIGLAFYRFFEIWSKGSIDDMMRGYQGEIRLRRSLSGKIGGNNDGGLADNKKPLTKLQNGDWVLTHKSELYNPHRRKLPLQGIENARQYAKQLKEQRVKANC